MSGTLSLRFTDAAGSQPDGHAQTEGEEQGCNPTRQADRDQDSTDQFGGHGQQQAVAMAHVERVREAG